jgi:integrase
VNGNTVVEWEDTEPFIFTMRGEVGPADNRTTKTIAIDLSTLREGFTDGFLLNFKDHLIDRQNQVKLASVKVDADNLRRLFRKTIDLKLFDSKISLIDEAFLLCVSAVQENLTKAEIDYPRTTFNNNHNSPIFAKGLNENDFPSWKSKKGAYGSQIDRILAKALSQASVAHILDLCDTAYAAGRIDIGHYSFAHLAFAVFVRSNSYMQIRVGDFWYDSKAKQYFIDIVTSKTGELVPSKVRYGLNEHLGLLLTKQRQHVIDTYGHLVAEDDVKKLALFPARQLRSGRSRWTHKYANQNYGMYENSASFILGYPQAIKIHLKDDKINLNSNALRHTLGTLLAQAGASEMTIQAVLKHATPTVCRAYVDIAFHGLIEELSEAMRPAFAEHLPGLLNFRSKCDPVAPEKLIRSEDLETGRTEDTGECGKSIVCENAPIVCYTCFRFTPCWDADHSINLDIAQREIEDMTKRGKPFQQMVERARTAKNRILMIMNAADRHRDAMQQDTQA